MTIAYRLLRKYRGYILPSHRRTYREVLGRGGLQRGDEKRAFVFFDFGSSRVDVDAGRYTFALVRDFEEAGFTSCYRDDFPFLSSMRYKRYKSMLLEREFRVCKSPADLPRGSLRLIVSDHKINSIAAAAKTLRVSYDRRLPTAPNEVTMPFRVYPGLYGNLTALGNIDREKERPWRCFFSGTVTARYGRTVLEKRFGKMSRLAILGTLDQRLDKSEIHVLVSDADAVPARPCFVRAGEAYRVPQERWFATLAKADFFLACPGGSMPICHNLVEAMASGAVPILEYPEYLEPPLRDGVNCLLFSGADGLLKTMRRALKMKPAQIEPMRKAAFDYYQKHLAPGIFAREVTSTPQKEITLLFNSPHVRRSH
jgi:hypothetical protein